MSSYHFHQALRRPFALRGKRAMLAFVALLVMLSLDAGFVFLHFQHSFGEAFASRDFNIEFDGGYAERFQYLKFAGIIVLLGILTVLWRCAAFIGWIAMFCYLLLDDALTLHESFGKRLGNKLASHFDFVMPFNLRPQDLGELLVWLSAASVLLPLLLWSWRRSGLIFRKVSADIALLLVALGCFAAGVDMLHVALMWHEGLDFALGLIEDGGEMVVVSCLFSYLLLRVLRAAPPTAYLHEAVLPLTIVRSLKVLGMSAAPRTP